jgi:hypothetical protein
MIVRDPVRGTTILGEARALTRRLLHLVQTDTLPA